MEQFGASAGQRITDSLLAKLTGVQILGRYGRDQLAGMGRFCDCKRECYCVAWREGEENVSFDEHLPKTLIEYDSSSNTGRLSFMSVMETVIVAVDDLFPVPVSWAITWKRDVDNEVLISLNSLRFFD